MQHADQGTWTPPMQHIDFTLTAAKLERKYGAAHPRFPRDAWKALVADDETTDGYWDWVADCLTSQEYIP